MYSILWDFKGTKTEDANDDVRGLPLRRKNILLRSCMMIWEFPLCNTSKEFNGIPKTRYANEQDPSSPKEDKVKSVKVCN